MSCYYIVRFEAKFRKSLIFRRRQVHVRLGLRGGKCGDTFYPGVHWISGLKGRDITAQGSALGTNANNIPALKGRHIGIWTNAPFASSSHGTTPALAAIPISRPFRAVLSLSRCSQGVALGCYVTAFQAFGKCPLAAHLVS